MWLLRTGEPCRDPSNVHSENARDVAFTGTESRVSAHAARHLCALLERCFCETGRSTSVGELRPTEYSVLELREANDDVEIFPLGREIVYPFPSLGVRTYSFECLNRTLRSPLDHLLGVDGEKVGLTVDAAEIEFGAVVGHEAALCVDGEEIAVSKLDVIVVEGVDILVCELGIEAILFGVEGVQEELTDCDFVCGERLREEAVEDHGEFLFVVCGG